jgi:hypothetical protein
MAQFRAVMRNDALKRKAFHDIVRDGQISKSVADSFYNPVSGIGDLNDPGVYNAATIPISMSPWEASAYYANGGIPGVIIDKKSKGVLLNGYRYVGGAEWTQDELKRLTEYSDQIGFRDAVSEVVRDALIFGGADIYPKFRKDTALSFSQTPEELLKAGILAKGCIEHFVVVDRWNCVIVPNWNVTARDYLYPDTFYVPLGGVQVSTRRSGLIRPKKLPYWAAIRQLGWGISDFVGYMPSLLGYEIIVMSIPIMAQQMSLLFHEFEMDGLVAQNGPDYVKENFVPQNQEEMRKWSMLNPIALNTFGKVSTVERHYENFDQLVMISRQDVGAKSGIPESVIFPSQPTGLADSRGEDVLLKQSETVQLIQVAVEPSLIPVAKMVAISCFGPEILPKLGSLKATFSMPTVQTKAQKSDSAVKFSQTIAQLVAADIPVASAIKIAMQFFDDVNVSSDLIESLTRPQEGVEGQPRADETPAEMFQRLIRVAGGNGGTEGVLRRLKEIAERAQDPIARLKTLQS